MSYQKVELAISKLIHLYPSPVQFLVAFSGGLDSTVMLDALCKHVSPQSIHAVYINHGLQPESNQWADACKKACERLGVKFESVDVQVSDISRQGIEAVARQKRYEALYSRVTKGTILLTAHHQRDQAETLLRNMARGAGISGLSGMPYVKNIQLNEQTLQHCRPLLNVDYDAIQSYAKQYRLDWVEDSSNQELDYRRNYLRHEVLPKIRHAWPFSDANFAKSAHHLNESLALLNELAEIDLQHTDYTDFYLSFTNVKELRWSRLKNMTRYWTESYVSGLRLNAKIYQWLQECLNNKNPQAKPKMLLARGELRFYNHVLYYFDDLKVHYCLAFDEFDASALQLFKALDFSEQLSSKQGGKLEGTVVRPLNPNDLSSGSQKKALKKWFKESKVPEWDRQRWPVLEKEGQVVAILGFYTKKSF
ncbi:MAG: tRNA lysidine(34) synthetase TilS [Hydrogenovibrio crunogenus]|nr:tRNA lysidine(34) synthetase TilS [Hydrogenovibrio crunogenus]